MIPHVFRYAAIAAAITGVAMGATASTGSWPLLARANGPSSLYLNDTVGVALNSPGIIERNMCLTVSLTKRAAYQCGDLLLQYQLPAVRVLGKTQAPTLLYNSQTAHPKPVLTLEVAIPSGTTTPDSIRYVANVNGTDRDSMTLRDSISVDPTSRRRIELPWDAWTDPTDVYHVVVTARSCYSGSCSTYSATAVTDVIVINRTNSPIGSGWWIGGVEQILVPSSDTATRLWVGGDGSARVYRPTGTSGHWAADSLDRPDTLTYNASVYERKLRGGFHVHYNATGQHTETLDPRGFATLFWYKSTAINAPLDSVKLPKLATAYQFVYTVSGADTTLDKVYSPRTSGRQTTEANSYGNILYQLFDPAGADEYYEIDQLSPANVARINSRRERAGRESRYAYNKAGHLTRVTAQVDSNRNGVTTICPFFAVTTVADTAAGDTACGTLVRRWANATINLDGPRTASLDTWAFRLQRFRAPEIIRDAHNNVTTLTYGP